MVYLIHLQPKFKHARHYLGSTTNLAARMADHKRGHGSKLLAAAYRAGSRLRIVRKWTGAKADGNLEQRLKHSHKSSDLCPVCNRRAGELGRISGVVSPWRNRGAKSKGKRRRKRL